MVTHECIGVYVCCIGVEACECAASEAAARQVAAARRRRMEIEEIANARRCGADQRSCYHIGELHRR